MTLKKDHSVTLELPEPYDTYTGTEVRVYRCEDGAAVITIGPQHSSTTHYQFHMKFSDIHLITEFFSGIQMVDMPWEEEA